MYESSANWDEVLRKVDRRAESMDYLTSALKNAEKNDRLWKNYVQAARHVSMPAKLARCRWKLIIQVSGFRRLIEKSASNVARALKHVQPWTNQNM